MKRSRKLNQQLEQRRPSLKQPIPKKLLSNSRINSSSLTYANSLFSILVLIMDTLPISHSFLQILNMLLGPLAILGCGILLLVLSDTHHIRAIYSRLVDPIICCLLFLSYLLMIFVPSMQNE